MHACMCMCQSLLCFFLQFHCAWFICVFVHCVFVSLSSRSLSFSLSCCNCHPLQKKLLFWADTFTLTLEFLTTPCAASFKLEMRKGMTNFPKNNKKGILAVLFL